MAYNIHLLQTLISVATYNQINYSDLNLKRLHTTLWKDLPTYIVAKCPFCATQNTEKIDTYSLKKWGYKSEWGFVTGSLFQYNLVVNHCSHFVIIQPFFGIKHITDDIQKRGIYDEQIPYVIGHLLEKDLALGVIHALPICNIYENEFVPENSLYFISYFSEQPQKVKDAIINYNNYSWEASATLYLMRFRVKPDWLDLTKWVAEKKLYWVDAYDPEFRILTGDVEAFPYKVLNP
jgi:hypothetical protein